MISHAFATSAVGAALFAPGERLRVALVAAICGMLPDLDVIGFRFDIAYADMLGHRGFSHSLVCAALIAAGLTLTLFRNARWRPLRARLFAVFFLATASHGVFDAMTDGGLGVAFFAPFTSERYFLPLRPIEVSPLSVGSFMTARGLAILKNELLWIWLPAAVLSILCIAASHRVRSVRAQREEHI